LQEEVDDAIAELEGMRKAAESGEAATVQLRKRLIGLQGTLRKQRQGATPYAYCQPLWRAVNTSICLTCHDSAHPTMPVWFCCT